jgi:hypothetical protein
MMYERESIQFLIIYVLKLFSFIMLNKTCNERDVNDNQK